MQARCAEIPVFKLFKYGTSSFSSVGGLECIAPIIQTIPDVPKPTQAQIKGHIPKWINGSILQVGAGKFEFGQDKYNSWFDGMALMSKFTVKDGSVTYSSRFLESDTYKRNKEENRITVSEYGTLASPNSSVQNSEIPLSDNCNTSWVTYKGDYYVTRENNFMHKVDIDTLESLGKVNWSEFISGCSASVHPHYEKDGATINMVTSCEAEGIRYKIIRIPHGKSHPGDTLEGARVIGSVTPTDRTRINYFHSFGMTENYIIFVEQPLMLNMSPEKALIDSFCLESDKPIVFHVVNKHTGKPHSMTFYTEPFLCFHHINAFEDQGNIVMDLCCLRDIGYLPIYTLENMRKSGRALEELYEKTVKAYPRRFVLPLDTQDVDLKPMEYSSAAVRRRDDGQAWCTPEDLHDDSLTLCGLQFPVINYSKYNTKKYRYVYGCGYHHLIGDSLIKMDLKTKRYKVWKDRGFYPSEPVFVPYPDSDREDQGVILSSVVTPHQNLNAFLLVLDAMDFSEIGRAELPVRMPYSFHGTFVSNNPE
uniref:Carotenoid-cleaving dioxygenase, mitochondrial n=1 Tax=Leptobrachium leishanense TaxID=445787 RepID=A0A8C5Q3D7_9ANUR